MGFFNRKKDVKSEVGEFENQFEGSSGIPSLPELPAMPELPNLPEEDISSIKNERKNFLPSFPPSKIGDKFNQSTIRDAVIDNNEENEYIPALPNQMKRYSREDNMSMRVPMSKPIKSQFTKRDDKSRTLEMSEFSRQIPNQMMDIDRVRRAEPLFIRLDTFESALSSFNEIKLRTHEIETLVRNIKEVKIKEEKELNEWEREIQTIKTRLEQIDKEIFEKIR